MNVNKLCVSLFYEFFGLNWILCVFFFDVIVMIININWGIFLWYVLNVNVLFYVERNFYYSV